MLPAVRHLRRPRGAAQLSAAADGQGQRASDPEIEAALWDRLSFRRFVGLGLPDPVPDHSTISQPLFVEVTRQLDAAGFLVKAGTLMDATLVAAQARRPSRGARGGQRHRPGRDLDPAAHLGVDAGSGLIRRAVT